MTEEEVGKRDKSVECFEIIGDRSQLGPKEEEAKPEDTNGNVKDGPSTSKGNKSATPFHRIIIFKYFELLMIMFLLFS